MTEKENEKIPDSNNKTGETEQEFWQKLIDNLETKLEDIRQSSDSQLESFSNIFKVLPEGAEELRQLSDNQQRSFLRILEGGENLIRQLRIIYGLPPPKPKTIH